MATPRNAASACAATAAPARPLRAADRIRSLVEGHEAVARSARGMFPIAHKAKGEPTCDLPTQRRDSHDKAAWMPRSLLEE
ncbi:MAG: hypothetical protein AMXMBFR78_36770 [Rubrivivax sp.]